VSRPFSQESEIVGVIPAAGLATRLGPIPCSKEILPLGLQGGVTTDSPPITATELLIHKFRQAGARRVCVVLRDGKWDIPAYLGSGHRFDVDIAYLLMQFPFGQPFTLDATYHFVQDAVVLLGFPDILFGDEDAFIPLLQRMAEARADLVVGLFPGNRPDKLDMVQLDDQGNPVGFRIKPRKTMLTHTWLHAAWSPLFTDFLHQHIAARLRDHSVRGPGGRELYMADIFDAAVREGLSVASVFFTDADYLDIGTPGDLSAARQRKLAAVGYRERYRQ
jgi:glucose-1-phosphate thymidylyltransferase